MSAKVAKVTLLQVSVGGRDWEWMTPEQLTAVLKAGHSVELSGQRQTGVQP